MQILLVLTLLAATAWGQTELEGNTGLQRFLLKSRVHAEHESHVESQPEPTAEVEPEWSRQRERIRETLKAGDPRRRLLGRFIRRAYRRATRWVHRAVRHVHRHVTRIVHRVVQRVVYRKPPDIYERIPHVFERHYMPKAMLVKYGRGFCKNKYYAGYDGKGLDSQKACNTLCMKEHQCRYASWYQDKTCSRYSANDCLLNEDLNHMTFAKTENGIKDSCFTVTAGRSSHKKKEIVRVGLKAFTCPIFLDQYNWLGGRKSNEVFRIHRQGPNKLWVELISGGLRPWRWQWDLKFRCCMQDTCVTNGIGNVAQGTPCTGWYGDNQCVQNGKSCCQGTGHGGQGWCGVGKKPGDKRWGGCSVGCASTAGFDKGKYKNNHHRIMSIGAYCPSGYRWRAKKIAGSGERVVNAPYAEACATECSKQATCRGFKFQRDFDQKCLLYTSIAGLEAEISNPNRREGQGIFNRGRQDFNNVNCQQFSNQFKRVMCCREQSQDTRARAACMGKMNSSNGWGRRRLDAGDFTPERVHRKQMTETTRAKRRELSEEPERRNRIRKHLEDSGGRRRLLIKYINKIRNVYRYRGAARRHIIRQGQMKFSLPTNNHRQGTVKPWQISNCIKDGGARQTFHDDIMGGGWKLVRRVKGGRTWHPAKDHLKGTQQYGWFRDDPVASETFSRKFDKERYDQFLFASGDGTVWMVTDRLSVNNEFYNKEKRPAEGSSKKDKPYMTLMYNRQNVHSDPHITMDSAHDVVYLGSSSRHHSHWLHTKIGFNVFIRKIRRTGTHAKYILGKRQGDSMTAVDCPVGYARIKTSWECKKATRRLNVKPMGKVQSWGKAACYCGQWKENTHFNRSPNCKIQDTYAEFRPICKSTEKGWRLQIIAMHNVEMTIVVDKGRPRLAVKKGAFKGVWAIVGEGVPQFRDSPKTRPSIISNVPDELAGNRYFMGPVNSGVVHLEIIMPAGSRAVILLSFGNNKEARAGVHTLPKPIDELVYPSMKTGSFSEAEGFEAVYVSNNEILKQKKWGQTHEMEEYGKGTCNECYYAGYDNKGVQSLNNCKSLCLKDPKCYYVSFKSGRTCSRYHCKDECSLNGETDHITYAKRPKSMVIDAEKMAPVLSAESAVASLDQEDPFAWYSDEEEEAVKEKEKELVETELTSRTEANAVEESKTEETAVGEGIANQVAEGRSGSMAFVALSLLLAMLLLKAGYEMIQAPVDPELQVKLLRV